MADSNISNLAIEYLYNQGHRIVGLNVINRYGKVLKLFRGRKYPTISINLSPIIGKRKYTSIKIHRLAAYQKYGNKIFGPNIQVRHLDGNPANFRLSNISIGTQVDNSMDIPSNVRKKRAIHAASFNIKHDYKKVLKIKKDRASGMIYSELQKKYSLSKGTLWYILNKR